MKKLLLIRKTVLQAIATWHLQCLAFDAFVVLKKELLEQAENFLQNLSTVIQ